MSLQPLLDASAAVQFHVATVVPAAVLGVIVFLCPKGTAFHRLLGRIWVVLMIATSVSTFFIHELKLFYGFSPIHLLSVFTIYGCLQAVYFARREDIRRHMRIMRSVYVGGIVVAGAFTFLPGRIMNAVVFGVGAVNIPAILLIIFVFVFALFAAMKWRLRAA